MILAFNKKNNFVEIMMFTKKKQKLISMILVFFKKALFVALVNFQSQHKKITNILYKIRYQRKILTKIGI